jgi:hypothetical protein
MVDTAKFYENSGAISPTSHRAGWLLSAPRTIVLTYVTFTYLLFLLSPFPWNANNHIFVFVVVFAAMFCFYLGYGIGMKRTPVVGRPLPIKAIVVLGGILTLVALIPSAQIYTGRWPWQFMDALADQKKAYEGLAQQLRDTEGQRGLIALVRALISPLTLACSTLGIIYWKKIGLTGKFFTVSALLSAIIFSILRGTNREIVDTLLYIVSSVSIVMARASLQSTEKAMNGKKIFRYFALGSLFILICYIIFIVFLARIDDRVGVQSALCLGESMVCVDFNSGVYAYLPHEVTRTIAILTGYLGTGYFGISLALNEHFHSGYGLAHSTALLSVYRQFVGEPDAVFQSYPYLLYYQNWDPAAQWSGMLTWIAGDIGFTGAVFVMGIIGYCFARLWVSAIQACNNAAVMGFSILALTMFYFPGNFQLGLYIDGYSMLVAALLIFKIWRPAQSRLRPG